MTLAELHGVASSVAARVAWRAVQRWTWLEVGEVLGVAFLGARNALLRWRKDGGSSPARWAWPRARAAVETWVRQELARRRRFLRVIEGWDADERPAPGLAPGDRNALRSALERARLSADEARALVSWAWGESGQERARRHGTAESTESRRLGDALDLVGAGRGRATTSRGRRKDRHERPRRTHLAIGATS